MAKATEKLLVQSRMVAISTHQEADRSGSFTSQRSGQAPLSPGASSTSSRQRTIPEQHFSHFGVSLAEAAVKKHLMEMSQEDDDDESEDTSELAANEAEEFITAETSVNLNTDNTPPAASVTGNAQGCPSATGLIKSSLRVTTRTSALAASAASESEYNLACSSNSSPEHKIHTVVIGHSNSSAQPSSPPTAK